MVTKIILVSVSILCYILDILAFSWAARKASQKHGIGFKDIKNEVPNGYVIRTIFSLFYYFFIFDWIFAWRLLPWAYLPFPGWVNWCGLVLFVVNTAFFWWICIALGANYHGPLRLHDAHELVTSGPYAHIRHPTYLAFLLLHTGLFLISSNWIILIAGVIMSSLVNHHRMVIEERLLLERFGDRYRDYMARTGKIFPRF